MGGGLEIQLESACCSTWAICYGAFMCNDLYGRYYVSNYVRYDQKRANKEHDCEYITQLGQRKIISKIIYYYYFLQYCQDKDYIWET